MPTRSGVRCPKDRTMPLKRDRPTPLRHVARLRCPGCGRILAEQMPSEGQVLHTICFSCGTGVPAPEGTCCVYCAFADNPCPDEQRRLAGERKKRGRSLRLPRIASRWGKARLADR